MTRLKKRHKCKHCRKFFTPDPRNAHKQKYCGEPGCRKASKAAAQAKWRASEKGRDYFRGPDNVNRVQEWRKVNPGYWRRPPESRQDALQDHLKSKSAESQVVAGRLPCNALQDLLTEQLPVVVGLIAKLTGTALQDDIVNTTRHLQQLGADILNTTPLNLQGGNYARQTTYSSSPDPPGS